MPIFIKRFLGTAGIPKVKLILPSECIGTEIISLYQSMLSNHKDFLIKTEWEEEYVLKQKQELVNSLHRIFVDATIYKIDMAEIMRELYAELKKEIEEQNND